MLLWPVFFVDRIGAYDLISRSAMLEGLLKMDRGDEILPFVQCFHGSPSTYLWEDEVGMSHEIAQGEGGEQGDPLMPMRFALGLHPALRGARSTSANFNFGKFLFSSSANPTSANVDFG